MTMNRVITAAIAIDAVLWGALVFFAIHFFQCPAA